MGTYSWRNKNILINSDSIHPIDFVYSLDNIVFATGKQQLIISTQKYKKDKKDEFAIENIEVYKDRQLVEFETVKPSFMNRALYIQTPPEAGEYTYVLRLKFEDKGIVIYGFAVRVDMP